MKPLAKPLVAAIFSAVLAAPTFASPLESLVDEIKRDLIINMPDNVGAVYLTVS